MNKFRPYSNSRSGKAGAVAVIVGAIIGIFLVAMMMFTVVFAPVGYVVGKVIEAPALSPLSIGISAARLGCRAKRLVPFIKDEDCWWVELMDVAEESDLVDALRISFDCSNMGEEARAAGECDPGALGFMENASILPRGKEQYLYLYMMAGSETGVPWELIASVHGARTYFGERNCSPDGTRGGSMRFSEREWQKFGFDGGRSPINNSRNDECWDVNNEGVSMDKDGHKDPRDIVDAIFTQARILKHFGADRKEWNYTGGPSGMCKPGGPREDGLYPFRSSGGALGHNSRVSIPRNILELADRYTYVRQDQTPPTFFLAYSDSRPVPGEGDPRTDRRYLPKKAANQIMNASAEALGLPFGFLDAPRPGGITVRQGFLNTLQGESTFRPSIRQGKIDDPNDNYPDNARGIIQFVPSTFWSWRVPGYDNIYNPLHNILAGMNAMKNSTSMAATKPTIKTSHGIWLTGSGWGPSGTNPYAAEGSEADSGRSSLEGPYTGKNIEWKKDPVSNALRQIYAAERQQTACYVAHIREWYEGFQQASVGGGAGHAPGNLPIGPSGMMWPSDGPLTSRFGPRWGRIHEGIDLGIPSGTPIYASADGRASYVDVMGGYGNTIDLDHGNNMMTRYAHLNMYYIRPGQRVTRGQVIALSGNTGNSTGPHLHFEVRVNGVAYDPLFYLGNR